MFVLYLICAGFLNSNFGTQLGKRMPIWSIIIVSITWYTLTHVTFETTQGVVANVVCNVGEPNLVGVG